MSETADQRARRLIRRWDSFGNELDLPLETNTLVKEFYSVAAAAREECAKFVESFDRQQIEPCDCISQTCEGWWQQDCDCGNHGDLAQAESWCAKRNQQRRLAAGIRALALEAAGLD